MLSGLLLSLTDLGNGAIWVADRLYAYSDAFIADFLATLREEFPDTANGNWLKRLSLVFAQ